MLDSDIGIRTSTKDSNVVFPISPEPGKPPNVASRGGRGEGMGEEKITPNIQPNKICGEDRGPNLY